MSKKKEDLRRKVLDKAVELLCDIRGGASLDTFGGYPHEAYFFMDHVLILDKGNESPKYACIEFYSEEDVLSWYHRRLGLEKKMRPYEDKLREVEKKWEEDMVKSGVVVGTSFTRRKAREDGLNKPIEFYDSKAHKDFFRKYPEFEDMLNEYQDDFGPDEVDY